MPHRDVVNGWRTSDAKPPEASFQQAAEQGSLCCRLFLAVAP